MNAAYLYLQLYKLFDEITPINADCGELCEKACCRGGDDSGMLLFPGECEVYRLLEPNWARLDKTDMTYEWNGKTYRVPILFCDGCCDRYQRPLSCRIFPLTPRLDGEGRLEIVTDPRAKHVCPISRGFLPGDYSAKFVKNIRRSFTLLMKSSRFRAFMKEYTNYLDDFGKFISNQ